MVWLLLLALAAPVADARPQRGASLSTEEADLPPPSADLTDVVEAAELGNRGDREGAVVILDAVLTRRPEHAEARMLRGHQHYLLGNTELAIADLSEALTGDRYEEHHGQTTFDEVTNATYVLDLGETRSTGAAMLVSLLARGGKAADAADVLAYAFDRHGPTAPLIAADAELQHTVGDSGSWARLIEAVDASRGEGFVLGVVARLAGNDPDGVPPEVYTWLEGAGDWKAPYNRAVGDLRAKRHSACVATIAKGLTANPGNQRLLELGYRCASRSDRAQASKWLEALGGPRRAPAGDVLAHAELLQRAGEGDQAEALVTGLPRRLDDASAERAARFRIDLLLAQGDLGRAARLCDGTAPDADARVAHALIERGDISAARPILERACPLLHGDAAHASCTQLLRWARAQ
ncbi:MAG: tetratricopeptide (TPR) repeat protein [Myxococcota bacterium]|jgi:tetratricopeptide (TPR) repeat protein